MEFLKKIIATFARVQQGHEAMPDNNAATDQARRETVQEQNRERQEEERFREKEEEQAEEESEKPRQI